MNITYDSSIITLSPSGSSSYTVVSNSSGLIVLSSFKTQSYNLLQVVGLTVTNPQAAVNYTITCLFYLSESNITYNIEAFYRTITLTAAPFTSLASTSILTYGVQSSVTISSSTPYTAKNNGTTLAYMILTYNNNQISFINGSNCVEISSTTCSFVSSSSVTLTNLLASIGSFTTTTLTLTLYTYFNFAFYPLCQSNVAVSYKIQSVTVTSNTALCTSTVVAAQNNISLIFTASSIAAGDIVYISGFKGLPSSTWTQIQVSSATWYTYTLKTANLVSFNSTSSTVTVYLPYSNSNYTISTLNLTSINIYRSSVLYSTSNTSPILCPVTTPLNISTSSLIPSQSATYSPNTIELDVSMQFFDYSPGDYLVARFRSSSFGENYLLAGAYLGLNYGVTVNGMAASITNVNDTALKIILQSNMVPSVGSPVLKIIFSNIANPPIQDTIWVQLISYEGTTDGLK